MLTDIFADRYEDKVLCVHFVDRDKRLLVQLFRLIDSDVSPGRGLDADNDPTGAAYWARLDRNLSMELGLASLSDPTDQMGRNLPPFRICGEWFLDTPDNPRQSNELMLNRLSFVELAFRYRAEGIEGRARQIEDDPNNSLARLSTALGISWEQQLASDRESFDGAVTELNQRLLRAGYPLHYHNGMLQFSEDEAIQHEVEEPFWRLVEHPKWANVDEDMKRAIDHRDNGGVDPAFYAARALESTIKIISDEKGWTHGGENGAHRYIDNLASKKNGKFIEVWEADAMKHFFTHVRNPFGHGSGSEPIHSLTSQQTNWSIAFCMASILSLISRL